MKIQNTSGQENFIHSFNKNLQIQQQKQTNNESNKTGDKLEISREAQQLISNQKVEEKDLTKIQEKIQSNFYNSKEVLNKVADLILKDLTKK